MKLVKGSHLASNPEQTPFLNTEAGRGSVLLQNGDLSSLN